MTHFERLKKRTPSQQIADYVDKLDSIGSFENKQNEWLELIINNEIGVIYFSLNSFGEVCITDISTEDTDISKSEMLEYAEELKTLLEEQYQEVSQEYDEWNEHGFRDETDYWQWKGY